MDLVLRCLVLFPLVVVLVRVVNRRQLHSLEPFDIVLLVVLGDLLQQGVTQNDFSVTGAMLATGTLAMMTLLFSWLAFRFHRLQPILEGDPVILVERGTPIEKNLRRNRITLEELAAQARMQQVAYIEDIEWAVLETSGSISVIPKR